MQLSRRAIFLNPQYSDGCQRGEREQRALGEYLNQYQLNHVAPSILPRGLINRSNWCFVNAILVKPIANVDDRSIYDAYKEVFETLEAKGYKPKMNVMDNQATKYIKQFLTKKECKLQVVEPHNHRVNAAERAIQTFKDAFIATLATTDRDFPLQLWDKLALQVQDTLNLLWASRINPDISAYEALSGPYNWDRYPLAPPGCKAVIYKAPAVRGGI